MDAHFTALLLSPDTSTLLKVPPRPFLLLSLSVLSYFSSSSTVVVVVGIVLLVLLVVAAASDSLRLCFPTS
eukprot:2090514-Rhodomonas_salina.1